MQYNLTIIDRMILESLQVRPQNLMDIELSTNIEKKLLLKTLTTLITKNLIVKKGESYKVNPNICQRIQNELNDKSNLLCEVNEIINSCLRGNLKHKKNKLFRLKKVNMTKREEKIYNGLLYNLESFINSLEKTDQVAKQKIIFWGEGNYEDIKNSILNF